MLRAQIIQINLSLAPLNPEPLKLLNHEPFDPQTDKSWYVSTPRAQKPETPQPLNRETLPHCELLQTPMKTLQSPTKPPKPYSNY